MFKNLVGRIEALWNRIEHVAAPPERTVLLVTASQSVQTDLHVLSIQEGWRILFARSLDAALRILTIHGAAVIIYDLDLPEVAWRRALRSLLDAAPVIFILLSSIADRCIWEAVLDGGGYDVAQKPLDRTKLVCLVNGAFALTSSIES